MPLLPCNLMNDALGLTRISLTQYVLASSICMLPGTLADTWLGYAGRQAFDGNNAAMEYGLIALVLLALVAFLSRLVRRWQASRLPAWIEVHALAARLSGSRTTTLVDVREPDEFVGPLGHIKDAINLPVAELPVRVAELSPFTNKTVVLVCRTDKRSASAATFLRGHGFSDIHVLRGGMVSWNQAQLPIERD
jgi:rhodanese-related sulfurtransferase